MSNPTTFDWIGYGQNWLAGNTVGLIWSGRYGVVDPWTKANSVTDQAFELMRASGGTLTLDQATAIANRDVTNALVSAGADPSQAGKNRDLVETLGTVLTWALVIALIYIFIQVALIGKAWREVLSP